MKLQNMTFDDIMAYDGRNREFFKEIVRLQKDKLLTPFIGAGLSAFHFPCWRDFLNAEFKDYVPELTMPDDLLDAASLLCEEISEMSLCDDVYNKFGGDNNYDWETVMKLSKDEAVSLLPKLFLDLVITTNFDRVLEHVYGEGKHTITPIAHPGKDTMLNRAILYKDPLIFKVHGCVTERDNIILTRESYNNAYKPDSELVNALKTIYSKRALFFLGCSLEDRTIDLWTEQLIQVKGIHHYAIINCEPEERKTRRKVLGKKRIKAILYEGNKHEAVRIILEQLYREVYGLNPEDVSVPPNNLIRKNDAFTGRDDIFRGMENTLDANRNVVLTQTISGLGGVGKTQTALEYAHRSIKRMRYKSGICWLDSENGNRIYDGCLTFAKAVGFVSNNDNPLTYPDEAALKKWFVQWLKSRDDWLIIFDNVNELKHIESYIPVVQLSHGHILITTRNRVLGFGCPIELPPFSIDDAIEFLCKRTGHTNRSDAGRVAERLGCLPLALEQAAAYMNTVSNLSFDGYLQRFTDVGLRLFNEEYAKSSTMGYKEIVTTTWRVSFNSISNKISRQFFYLCSYIDSDNIPIDVFTTRKDYIPEPLKSALEKDVYADSIIAELSHMHMLLQAFIKTSVQIKKNK